MTLTTAHLLLIAFGFGLLAGCLVSYLIIRRTLRRNIRKIARVERALNERRNEKERESIARRESLILLADKLKQIEGNLHKTKPNEYVSYIHRLNRILNDSGIAEVK